MNVDWRETRAVLEQYARKLIEQYRANLKEGDSFASGHLYNDINFTVRMGTSRHSVVITLADYWKYVENGRRAGSKMPPIGAIEEWIRVKPVIPEVRNGRTPSVRSLAFLIARAISRRGIPANKPFQRAFDALLSELREEVQRAAVEDIKRGLS